MKRGKESGKIMGHMKRMVDSMMDGIRGKASCQDQEFEIYPIGSTVPMKVSCSSYMLQGNVSIRTGCVTNVHTSHFSIVSNNKFHFLLTIYILCQLAYSFAHLGFTLGPRMRKQPLPRTLWGGCCKGEKSIRQIVCWLRTSAGK